MRCGLYFFPHLAIASLALCTSLATHADITKCIDSDGHTSYSDGGVRACNDGDSIATIAIPEPVEARVETHVDKLVKNIKICFGLAT